MRKSLLGLAAALAVSAALCVGAPAPAKATTVTDTFSGNFGTNLVSGNYSLDVVGGQALDGTGIFTGFGLVDVPMVMITPLTPGNEGGPVGFRANDGTDLFGANTNYPWDSVGSLWDINTSVASFGQFPLLNLASGANNSMFTGNVDGTEYYAQLGTIGVQTTPLPRALPLFASALCGVGGLMFWRRKKKAGAPLMSAVPA